MVFLSRVKKTSELYRWKKKHLKGAFLLFKQSIELSFVFATQTRHQHRIVVLHRIDDFLVLILFNNLYFTENVKYYLAVLTFYYLQVVLIVNEIKSPKDNYLVHKKQIHKLSAFFVLHIDNINFLIKFIKPSLHLV